MKLTDIEKHFGTREAAGKALGAWRGTDPPTKAAFTHWKKGVPSGVQAEFQLITGGKLQVERANGKRRRA